MSKKINSTLAANSAARIISHYLSQVYLVSGIGWPPEYEQEIHEAVELIVSAAIDEVVAETKVQFDAILNALTLSLHNAGISDEEIEDALADQNTTDG